ncbi:MAG TPA: hypothetical protein VE891_07630 [Allosphingosinicella sp.]|nr:hypothetical protein [Allosphingosinicella sp.]
MPYDQIVFIGYAIDTAPRPADNKYLGIDPPAADIAARCRLMLGAMEKAATLVPPAASPPGSTLYVFVAPEFFFRGPTGAYSMDDVQVAVAELQSMAGAERWNDWAFAFGTILGQYEAAVPNQPVQICNFALVQQGGLAAQGPNGARSVVKEFMSGIDFVASQPNSGGLLLGAVAHPEAAPRGPGSEAQQKNYDGAGIFELAGLNWAVEICRDHLLQRLQRSPALPGDPLVQVQLVPSCGAGFDARSVIAQPGGYILNVDGFRPNGNATLYQAGPQPRPVVAQVTPVGITEVTVSSPPVPGVAVSDLYCNGSGSLYVYPAQPIPAQGTVPGSTSTYKWRASDPDWTLTFYLIYDDAGAFSNLLCKIDSTEIDFGGIAYFMPLYLNVTIPPSSPGAGPETGKINLWLGMGGNQYDHGLYADINVPGFNFQGEIMQFMSMKNDPKPLRKIWADPQEPSRSK